MRESVKFFHPLNKYIESAFGRVKNRIKRIGRRWSQEGLLRWLKLAQAGLSEDLQAVPLGLVLEAVPQAQSITSSGDDETGVPLAITSSRTFGTSSPWNVCCIFTLDVLISNREEGRICPKNSTIKHCRDE
jgi:hypothetical protein